MLVCDTFCYFSGHFPAGRRTKIIFWDRLLCWRLPVSTSQPADQVQQKLVWVFCRWRLFRTQSVVTSCSCWRCAGQQTRHIALSNTRPSMLYGSSTVPVPITKCGPCQYWRFLFKWKCFSLRAGRLKRSSDPRWWRTATSAGNAVKFLI